MPANLTVMSRLLALLLIGCASHTAPEQPIEPGPESRFFLARDADGTRFMVRVIAATGEVAAVGDALDFDGFLAEQNAPLDRALLVTYRDRRPESFAFRTGRWVSLCEEVETPYCEVRGTRELTHLSVSRHSLEGEETLALVETYSGHHLSTYGEQGRFIGSNEWSLWSGADEWAIDFGGESRVVTPLENEVAFVPFANHVLTYDRDRPSRQWFRSIPSGEARPVLCIDGAPHDHVDGNGPEYARCSDELVRYGDGRLEPTGVLHVDAEFTNLVFVVDDEFALRATGAPLEPRIRLHDREGALLGEYVWSPGEVEVPAGETLDSSAQAVDTVGDARGVVTIASFERRVFGPSTFVPQRETLLLTFARDGSVTSFPLDVEFSDPRNTWLPRSVDRVYWVTDDGRLMMRGTYDGVTTDVSAGWNFAR